MYSLYSGSENGSLNTLYAGNVPLSLHMWRDKRK